MVHLARNTSVRNTFCILMWMLTIGAATGYGRERVSIWSLPEGPIEMTQRKGWVPLRERAVATDAVALENRHLVLMLKTGADAIQMYSKVSGVRSAPIRLSLWETDEKKIELRGLKVKAATKQEATAEIQTERGRAQVILKASDPFLTVLASDDIRYLNVGVLARYSILPDFFGYDAVFDPRRISSQRLRIPAENFVLQLAEDGHAMIMCVWPGRSAMKEKVQEQEDIPRKFPDSEVTLELSGEKKKRRITSTWIEFKKAPIHVALLSKKGIWHAEEISGLTPQQPTRIKWKRPFDARWRVNTMLMPGKESRDFLSQSQSFNAQYEPKPGSPEAKNWKQGCPVFSSQVLGRYIHPAWFKGEQTFIAGYLGMKYRSKITLYRARQAHEKSIAESKKKIFTPTPFPGKRPNDYERMLFYPLDRLSSTPREIYTPVDVVRGTLGQGPCEYILSLEGIKARAASGRKGRKLLANGVCLLLSEHLEPILSKRKQGIPLPAQTKKHLKHAIEDMGLFVRAVFDRIMEYKRFDVELLKHCATARKQGVADAFCDAVERQALAMQKGFNREFTLDETQAELRRWEANLKKVLTEVEKERYDSAWSLLELRQLAARQDGILSEARRRTKSILHASLIAEAQQPQEREFLSLVRKLCRRVLQRMHPVERVVTDVP